MADSSDFLGSLDAEVVRRATPRYPEGWEPGVVWDGVAGVVTSMAVDGGPVWREALERAGIDPDAVEVIEPVQVRTWDAAIGNGEVRTMKYFRTTVRTKRENRPDIEELLALVSPRQRVADRPSGPEAFVVPQSDWQLGKRGTAQAIDGIVQRIDEASVRLKTLRARPGRSIGSVVIPFLGDLGESCDGHYAMQAFEVELDYREQRRVGRRLALYAVDTLGHLAERCVVPVVPGNHGEFRRNGKAYTTFGDNQDIEIVEGVAEACAMNPAAYGGVSFVIPKNELTLTLDVGGLITAFAHGHQARTSGSTAQAKLASWWSGQAFGMRPAGDASVLYTGHYHHLSIVEHGPRTHIQVPAMDMGSQWWDETKGTKSRQGVLTLVQGPDGLHEIEVL